MGNYVNFCMQVNIWIRKYISRMIETNLNIIYSISFRNKNIRSYIKIKMQI